MSWVNSLPKIASGEIMSRAIAFIICLCCSLFFGCSSEDSSSTIEAPQNSQVETETVAEDPVEVDE